MLYYRNNLLRPTSSQYFKRDSQSLYNTNRKYQVIIMILVILVFLLTYWYWQTSRDAQIKIQNLNNQLADIELCKKKED